MKKKTIIFIALFLSISLYIAWIFYMSEPKYIDNINSERQAKIQKYDVVSTHNNLGDLDIGMIIQIDTTDVKQTKAIVKNFENAYSNDNFTTIHLTSIPKTDSCQLGFTIDYRVIGRGTFYHKVNHFIGFNIMMTTTALLVIIELIIAIVLIGILREWLGYDSFF